MGTKSDGDFAYIDALKKHVFQVFSASSQVPISMNALASTSSTYAPVSLLAVGGNTLLERGFPVRDVNVLELGLSLLGSNICITEAPLHI